METEGENPVQPVVVLKSVFGLLGVSSTCQYLFIRSRVEMKQALPRHSMRSSTWGMGLVSNSETWFSLLKSLHSHRLPLGLGMMTIGLDHVLADSSMTPH